MKYNNKKLEEFLIESNAIEGVYDDDSLQQAKYAWGYLETQEKLTTGVILKTHKIIGLHQPLAPNEKGYFRTVPVWIGGREGVRHDKIRDVIDHWVMNVMDLIDNGKKEPKIFLERVIKTQHVEYEKIHPFVDINGRTGRLFLNWTRLKLGLPILIIKATERGKYYQWFRD